MSSDDKDTDFGAEELVMDRNKPSIPPMYKVLLHNDNFTPMDFVTTVLVEYFHKNSEQAQEIMLAVHNNGTGVAGTYTRDVAKTKITLVTQSAKKNGHPLKCTMEIE